jgi:hypothetical protein
VTHNTVEPSNHPVADHTVSNEQKSTELYPDSSISSSDKSSSAGQDGRVSEEEICAICLAPFESENPVSFTTCCGHTFHILCTQSLENSQCPVCRSYSERHCDGIIFAENVSNLYHIISLLILLIGHSWMMLPWTLNPDVQCAPGPTPSLQ